MRCLSFLHWNQFLDFRLLLSFCLKSESTCNLFWCLVFCFAFWTKRNADNPFLYKYVVEKCTNNLMALLASFSPKIQKKKFQKDVFQYQMDRTKIAPFLLNPIRQLQPMEPRLYAVIPSTMAGCFSFSSLLHGGLSCLNPNWELHSNFLSVEGMRREAEVDGRVGWERLIVTHRLGFGIFNAAMRTLLSHLLHSQTKQSLAMCI